MDGVVSLNGYRDLRKYAARLLWIVSNLVHLHETCCTNSSASLSKLQTIATGTKPGCVSENGTYLTVLRVAAPLAADPATYEVAVQVRVCVFLGHGDIPRQRITLSP